VWQAFVSAGREFGMGLVWFAAQVISGLVSAGQEKPLADRLAAILRRIDATTTDAYRDAGQEKPLAVHHAAIQVHISATATDAYRDAVRTTYFAVHHAAIQVHISANTTGVRCGVPTEQRVVLVVAMGKIGVSMACASACQGQSAVWGWRAMIGTCVFGFRTVAHSKRNVEPLAATTRNSATVRAIVNFDAQEACLCAKAPAAIKINCASVGNANAIRISR